MRLWNYLGIILITIVSCDDPQSTGNHEGKIRILSPEDGSTISENARIDFTLPDQGTTKMVELWVNDLPDTADLVPPFNLELSTVNLSDSITYSIFIRAYYADNRRLDSKPINLSVDNSASYPTKPRIISVQYLNGDFVIKWVRNEDEDFYAYYLYE